MSKSLSEIDVNASLRCELDGENISITAADRKVVVEVPDVATGLKLLQLGSSRGSRLARLHRVKRLLDLATHSLHVRVKGDTIFSVGHRIGSRWWRLFGLPEMDARPRLIISHLARQR